MKDHIMDIIIITLNALYAFWNMKLLDQSTKDVHDLQVTFQLIAINNELLLMIRENEKELSDECVDKINEVLSINKTFTKSTHIYKLGRKNNERQ